METDRTVAEGAAYVAAGLRDAGAEIDRIAREEIAPAAALIEEAFDAAANGIERRLVAAARAGELSLKGLGRQIAATLRTSLIDGLVRRPVETLLAGVFAAPFGGARAGGGFVAPGASYLVGERGPEWFTPGATGAVSPAASAASRAVSVSITLPGVTDAESFRRSETQIAAALARALGRGQRNL